MMHAQGPIKRSISQEYKSVNSMTLKTRIFLLAPLAMLGMLVVGAIFYYGNLIEQDYRTRLAQIQQLWTVDAEIETSLLQARRHEKDFLLRSDTRYSDRHAETSAQIMAEIARLDDLAKANVSGVLDQQIDAVKSGFERYLASFTSLVEKRKLIGLDETSGLQGALRTAVHEAEEYLGTLEQPELTVKMLMMRRHEKDFIMRMDEKYVGRLDERVAEFKQFPATMFGSIATRDRIFQLLDTYQANFKAFASGTLEELTLRSELSAAYSDVEPVLAEVKTISTELRDAVAQELKSAQANIQQMVIIATLLAILIIGAVVLIVARSVSKPLLSTVAALQALARDETGVELQGKDRKDEIGEIATAFQACQDLAITKARQEQEAASQREVEERKRGAEQARLDAEQKRNLEAAIGALGTALDSLSNGDLTASINQPFVGELDKLRQSFNGSLAKLAGTMSEVKASSDGIQSSSEEMRSAVNELSSRTERQAAALEESSAALEQINSTVASSSNRAQDATRKVAEAKSASDSSTKVVSDAVNAMGNIKDASDEISKIIGVIDEIAFQTNLLALNAGVEAARAGEAGKGFAVVAQEVRELAQRSASAAKEIKGLISKSSVAVESGVDLVTATGDALATIAATMSATSMITSTRSRRRRRNSRRDFRKSVPQSARWIR